MSFALQKTSCTLKTTHCKEIKDLKYQDMKEN